MDVIRVHQGGDGVLLPDTAQHQPLCFRQILAGAPLAHMEGDVPVGLLDLLPVGPAGGSMLAVANRLGLDVVQIPTSGEVRAAAMSRSIPPASKINMIVCGVINSPHLLL